MYRHVPNLITIARLILTVVFFYILNYSTDQRDSFQFQMWLGFVLFLVAVLTDILDGYLARKWKVESAFGRVVDPFVDKILICGAFIFFSSNHFMTETIRAQFPGFPHKYPVTGVLPWMVVVLIAREFLITSIRGLAEAQGIDFRADWAGKIKMFTQSIAAGAVMVDLAVMDRVAWVKLVRDITIYTTIVVTILSATTYIFRARRLLKGPEMENA